MGSSTDVMELFAERDIRHLFSQYDGWNVEQLHGLPPGKLIYQARRAIRGYWGPQEVAFIAISFDPVLHDDLINALDLVPDGKSYRLKKYLLMPQAADASAVPPHIQVLPMHAFAFSGGDLVWLTKKKNAKKVIQEQAVAA